MSQSDLISGFDDLESIINDYTKKITNDKVEEVLEAGAKYIVNELLKLPKPRSHITSPSYTHLIDSFAYKKHKKQVEVGWGKYYGPMVENGTKGRNAQPHLIPIYEKNIENIYKIMIERIGLNGN